MKKTALYYLGVVALLTMIFAFTLPNPASKSAVSKSETPPKMNLSEYGFFVGNLADLKPAADVMPYDVNAALFSDYAYKARFIRLPQDTKATYHASESLDFPVGTAIIKNFYFPLDFRKPEQGRRILETRLLIREERGWKAYPYIWNESQTEATLDVAGDKVPISWIHYDGSTRQIEYSVPNINQCKNCHETSKVIVPLGTTARELNKNFNYENHSENQLVEMQKRGWIENMPPLAEIPKLVDWQDASQLLENRARAYLDANCGHCHNPKGSANTSGLFLHDGETDLAKLGVMKAPIAAGKGSGGFKFSILPQKPDESILIYRMKSLNPGEMMPELGRKQRHDEGVALLREWIAQMK